MEYRGIRYTIRAGIERGQWSVVIYPQGVETTGVKVFGTREPRCAPRVYERGAALIRDHQTGGPLSHHESLTRKGA